MKREVEREVKLPAFDLPVPELELLVQRVLELFESATPIRSSIKLTLPNERLQFESLDELKAYDRIRGRVTRFPLEFSQGSRQLTVKTAGVFASNATVRTEAETEVWCAGAVDTVRSIIQQNRAWYWWFVNLPFTLLFFCLSIGPLLVSWFSLLAFGGL